MMSDSFKLYPDKGIFCCNSEWERDFVSGDQRNENVKKCFEKGKFFFKRESYNIERTDLF